MPQADGYHKLSTIELVHDNKSIKFKINPQTITRGNPKRVAITKTPSRFVVEDFGDDVGPIEITGTTGSPRFGGDKKIKELIKFLEGINERNSGQTGDTPMKPIFFFNHTDDYALACTFQGGGWDIKRDVESPMTYTYEIHLYSLGYANDYQDKTTIDAKEVYQNYDINDGIVFKGKDRKTPGNNLNQAVTQ